MDQLLEYIRYFAFTILGGGAGYFIRLLIEHRLAIDRNKKNIEITEFNRASAKLRASFAPAQAKIRIGYYENGEALRDFFYEEIFVHASACEEFRPFVSDNVAYTKAWEEYEETVNYDRHTVHEGTMWRMNVIDNGEWVSRLTEAINEKIENILHLASPKLK